MSPVDVKMLTHEGRGAQSEHRNRPVLARPLRESTPGIEPQQGKIRKWSRALSCWATWV